MTAIPGVTIKKNSKGQLTHITIDVRKHQEAITVLKDLGLVPKSQFDIDFENGISVEELKESLFAHIKSGMQITIEPLVREKMYALVDVLIDEGYYATETAALKYVQAIIDFIYSLPTRTARKTNNNTYGEYFITYKPNRRTTWYITFDAFDERYIVRNVINNHNKDFPGFISGLPVTR